MGVNGVAQPAHLLLKTVGQQPRKPRELASNLDPFRE